MCSVCFTRIMTIVQLLCSKWHMKGLHERTAVQECAECRRVQAATSRQGYYAVHAGLAVHKVTATLHRHHYYLIAPAGQL
jgi:hypothetical protein